MVYPFALFKLADTNEDFATSCFAAENITSIFQSQESQLSTERFAMTQAWDSDEEAAMKMGCA